MTSSRASRERRWRSTRRSRPPSAGRRWASCGSVIGSSIPAGGRSARATERWHERPCRRVVFSDGTSVVADVDHLWEVRTKYDRRVGKNRLLSTGQMEQRLRLPNGEYAFHVDEALPVRYFERELPLDPYVLGIWLGDGASATAEVTTA